ncbi:MAG: hypothetical protein WC028_14070 [Candidatus Obscuribacterales bacterium]
MTENNDDLVPNFLPTLGQRLALTQQSIGRFLSEKEISDCLDGAACMMVKRSHKVAQERKHGIVDIDPDNVALDWNSRRIEFTESCWPSIVLYVFTDPDCIKNCQQVLDQAKVEYEIEVNDSDAIEHVISEGSWYPPTLRSSPQDELTRAKNYFVVTSESFTSHQAIEVSRRFLEIIAKLFDNGAINISVESGNLGHSKEVWKEILRDRLEQPQQSLLMAFVQMPLTYDDFVYSCGMHHLGQQDFVISHDTLIKLGHSEDDYSLAAYNIFQSLALYLLSENRPKVFRSGNTFSIENGTLLRATVEPYMVLKETDIRFNQFGVWRITLPETVC